MNYKLSTFNINLKEEGYSNAKENEYYNILMGKFAVIPKDTDLNNPPEELKGFLVPHEVDEVENYVKAHEQSIYNDKPQKVSLVVAVTLKCNYRCEYCFERCNQGADMSEETQNDIIAYIKNEIDRNENLKSFHIAWFGGEPLLRLDVIKAISAFVIPYCEEKQIQYDANIVTNGYFLTKEVSQQLKDLHVTNVKIAIDGFAENYGRIRQISKDAYSKVLQNIENSVIPVNIMLNVTRNNTSEIIDLAKELLLLYSVKSGRTHIGLNRVKEYDVSLTNGFTDAEWLEFKNQLLLTLDNSRLANKWFKIPTVALRSCTKLGARNVTLCADGYIYRCDNDTGVIEKAVGTIKQGIDKENKVNKQYVSSTVNETCRQCKYLPICCGGQCRYEELLQGKNCLLTKERFRQNMKNYIKYVGIPTTSKSNNGSMLPTRTL